MKLPSSVFFFLCFTLLIAIPPALLQLAGNSQWLAPGFWTVFIFISAETLLVLLLMLIVKQKNADYFAQAFLGGTTFKILATLVFMLVFLRNNTVNKQVFLIDFVYIYLSNIVFEVYILLTNLRH